MDALAHSITRVGLASGIRFLDLQETGGTANCCAISGFRSMRFYDGPPFHVHSERGGSCFDQPLATGVVGFGKLYRVISMFDIPIYDFILYSMI
jgi:hypothetical protein